jgi:putative transposase
MVRHLMLACVEQRFAATRASHPVQWLADNGSAYTARETLEFAIAPGLVASFAPVRSPESNGVSEAFVKTLKCDYARIQSRPDAATLLQMLPPRIDDYNQHHPHGGLQMRSLREFIQCHSSPLISLTGEQLHLPCHASPIRLISPTSNGRLLSRI